LNAQKGHLLLLDAFARVARSVPEARLVLAGDGELRREVESRIDALGLRGRVEITGWISEAQVRQRIRAARALVMSSFAEGLPMVLMESLALGRPVIAPAIAGIPELVKAGQSGWLVTAGSSDELAAAMLEALAASPSCLEEVARTGRELVLRDHHTATETAKLETLLLGAMGSN
jgi:glycosyltransferase involved in cell wall biosynthesis